VELAYNPDSAFTHWVVRQGYLKRCSFSSMLACNTEHARGTGSANYLILHGFDAITEAVDCEALASSRNDPGCRSIISLNAAGAHGGTATLSLVLLSETGYMVRCPHQVAVGRIRILEMQARICEAVFFVVSTIRRFCSSPRVSHSTRLHMPLVTVTPISIEVHSRARHNMLTFGTARVLQRGVLHLRGRNNARMWLSKRAPEI
jgi:hypothetical protein